MTRLQNKKMGIGERRKPAESPVLVLYTKGRYKEERIPEKAASERRIGEAAPMLLKKQGRHFFIGQRNGKIRLAYYLSGNRISDIKTFRKEEREGSTLMKQILIVEDDKNLSRGIELALRKEYSCLQAYSVQSALELFREQPVDLILLDVNLPDGDGMDVLAEIRASSRVPIILLTANNMEMDIVAGLESGANDYITKPFSLMVLRARVGVQLRNETPCGHVFKSGTFSFDFDKMEFVKGGESLELSKTEQRLLRCLVENNGKVLSRGRLIDEVWQGDTEFVDEHALTVAVNRLRSKLGNGKESGECIKTVYGIGYAWMK